jgi:perosamine synthetase
MSEDRSREVFERAIRREFAFLKGTDSVADLHARALVFDHGLLLPVCELHADDEQLIGALSRWRREHADAFPTQFEVTDVGTARWLRRQLLDVEDRILFLVCDRHGHPVGHLGFANALGGDREIELDNVVRGEPGQRGLMSQSVSVLLGWAAEMFGPREVRLRVFDDNRHAVRFYERLGFVARGTTALHRSQEPSGAIRFSTAEPGETCDRRWLVMVHTDTPTACSNTEILTAGPSISSREVSYAVDAVRRGWNHHHSDYLDAFSRAFADYVGVRHALPTSSCTGALHLALLALGIGPGDEVIVPDLTWVATANAVAYTGATPVFADVEATGWCLDPQAFEAAITRRTRAVMPVHLYGHPARMDEIMRIADAHGLHVVEDAAPSIGAEVAGRRTGSFGDAAGFSFQGAKLLVTGEGGMLVTDSDEVYERARYLWGLGHDGDFWIGAIGWKYRMANVQAAIGLGQLERVDALVEAKRRVFEWYSEELQDVAGVTLSHEAARGRSIHWMTSVVIEREAGVSRDEVRAALRAAAIDTRPVFPAISRYPMWETRQEPGPVADRIGRTAMNLPSGVRLRRADVARVCAKLRWVLDRAGAAPGNGRMAA